MRHHRPKQGDRNVFPHRFEQRHPANRRSSDRRGFDRTCFAAVALVGLLVALGGCSSWMPGRSPASESPAASAAPSDRQSKTAFRSQGDGTPFFFFDSRAREIESSLGIGSDGASRHR